MSTTMLEIARQYVNSGLSPIPILTDGSKRPCVRWKPFQERIPTDDELLAMFSTNGCGIAIVCGPVSGNLEILDFETGAPVQEWAKHVHHQLGDEFLKRCPLIETPSKGYHVLYRCDQAVEGNQQLAMRYNEHGKPEVAIETRGSGGYFVTVGSPPSVHPDNRPYRLLRGDLNNIPIINANERAVLLSVARSFNEFVEPKRFVRESPVAPGTALRPGEDFNIRAQWEDILQPAGWIVVGHRGNVALWRRPGKQFGNSATTNHANSDLFYVFSTSAHPFEHQTAYSKFAAYALLNHRGDFKAAARELARQGFGAQSKPPSSGSTTTTAEEWPDPQPIRSELPPVTPLLPEMIPAPFRPWLLDVARRMGCPLDFVAAPAIVLVGAVVGAGCGIRPKRRDNWLVVPNLWGAVVSRPGIILKSPSLAEAIRPLERLEQEARAEYEEKVPEYEVELEVLEAKREAIRAQIRTAAKNEYKQKADGQIARHDLLNLQQPPQPTCKRYKTNDATVEKLSELLAENPRGLLLFRDELIGLFASWEREGHEGDRAFFMETWNGYGSHDTDRIGRGWIHTDNMCLSVLGGIPPAKLASYLFKAVRGNDNDGFVQRLQMTVYPDEPKLSDLVDDFPDTSAKNRAFEIIGKLAEMNFVQHGATPPIDDERIPYFQFDEAAQELFYEWFNDLMKRLRAEEEPVLIEHLAKYRSLMPSLALIFHLIQIADGQAVEAVSYSSAKMAAAWCGYLESHARRVYSLVTDVQRQAAAKLAKKLREGALPNPFTVRDVYRKGWGLLHDKDIAQDACDELVAAGWIREQESIYTGAGRPRLPEYIINPKVITHG
jgi:hypothetical protein